MKKMRENFENFLINICKEYLNLKTFHAGETTLKRASQKKLNENVLN